MAEIDLKTQIELAKYFKMAKKEWALWFLNLELFPFQSLLLDFLDAKTFPLIVMTRGGSKTMSFAVYAAYHATFYPGQSIVYVAPTFRQVKEFFDYLKKFYEESPLLREAAGDRPPIIYPDQAVFKIGKSKIRGFPLGDGSRIRGVRGHCILADELAMIPIEIFQVVIAGFAATQADPMERQRIKDLKDLLLKQGKTEEAASIIMPPENKLVIGGTAYYAFNHFCKYFSTYQEIINGSKDPLGAELYPSDPNDYGIFMASWEVLPETLMSKKMIEHVMSTMDRDLFDMEYNCQFKKDSSGFFPMSQLESCTLSNAVPTAPRVKIKGYPERIYVMGVDPASAESLTSDNFAIAVIEVDVENWKGYLVYSWAERNKTWQSYIAQTRRVIRQFKPQYLVIESQGGGTTLKQLLQDEKYIENPAEDEMIYERQEFNEDDKDKIGAHILEMFSPHSGNLSALNHDAKADLDHGLLFFAAPSSDREWESLNDLKKMGKGDQEIMMISDELDMANQNLIATKREISLVHIMQTKTGQEHFAIDPALKGIRTEDRPRKDRYSAWLYATHAFRQYLKKRRVLLEEEKDDPIPWAAWG